MRFNLRTLLTNGNEREARRLHSMTNMSLSRAIYWILNGPLMWSAWAICRLILLILLTVSTYNFWGGNWIVASPEWTPAYSICSEMAYASISPLRATASISISLACSINLLTTTGWSSLTLAANCKNLSSSSMLEQTFMAAPDNTYEGRTRTGKPTLSINWWISDIEVSALHSGWLIPFSVRSDENFARSSALSISLAEVPSMGTCCSSSRMARLLGICPPVEIITPFGHSKSMMSITRSNVSSSK